MQVNGPLGVWGNTQRTIWGFIRR